MTLYQYLGYGITDNNGKAKLEYDSQGNSISHSYTGTGAGLVDVVASLDSPSSISDSSLVSETFALYDCLKYDNATSSGPNNIWSANNVTLERKTEYSRVYETTTGTDGNLTTQIDHSVCIETDIQLVSTDYSRPFIALGQSANAQTRTSIGLPSSKRDGNWYHVKITFTNGTGTVAFDDESPSSLIVNNYDSTGNLYFRFVTGYEITEINFKNWKCYPI